MKDLVEETKGVSWRARKFATPHKSTDWLMPPCSSPFRRTENTTLSFRHLFQLFKPHFNGWQKSELICCLDSSPA